MRPRCAAFAPPDPAVAAIAAPTATRASRTIDRPAPGRVAPSISAASVRLHGAVPGRSVVVGRKVTITMPRTAGVACDSIALGPLTIRFAAGLRIGTARAAVVTHGAQRFTA